MAAYGPIVLILVFGAVAAWLRHRERLEPRTVSLLAAAAAALLLVDAISEPSRRPAGLLFVALGLVFAWRARYARSST